MWTSLLTITNNIIAFNNSGGIGGGISIDPYSNSVNLSISLVNNTIYHNEASIAGGGIHFSQFFTSASNIYNNILFDNLATAGADIYLRNDSDGDYIPSSVELRNNDFNQSPLGTYIQIPFPIDPSNLNNADPLFVDPINGDFHLKEGSPCIDAGSNDAPGLPTIDKDGQPRVVNDVVDIGAYEYQEIVAPVAAFSADITSGFTPLAVHYTDNSTGTISTREWDFGDGSPLSNNQNPVHAYTNSGVFTVHLTVTGPSGADTQTRVDYITAIQATGSLRVTINPAGAIDAGAVWRVDAGTWQNSGATVQGIPVGQRTVEYKDITGWTKPANQTVTVANGQTATVNVSYGSQLPIVSISSTDTHASEPGTDKAQFTVFRIGDVSKALTAKYTVGGTATNGIDYSRLSGSVTVPVGTSSAVVTITPRNDRIFEGAETVVLTIASGASYLVGDPSSATVTIVDEEQPPRMVTIEATDPFASEAGLDTGQFTIYRTGITAKPLTVMYSVSGTARSGMDYSRLTGRVTIPAGLSSAVIAVIPKQDATHEGEETVAITLRSNRSYQIGAPNTAVVTISDND